MGKSVPERKLPGSPAKKCSFGRKLSRKDSGARSPAKQLVKNKVPSAPVVTPILSAGVWESCSSIYVRCGLKGRLLQDWARKTYVIEENALVPWFVKGPDGKRKKTLRRAKLNNRNQHNTRAKYKNIIKKEGVITGARGELITITDEKDKDIEWVIGGAHMCEALYDAEAEEPENKNITASIAAGIRVTRLDKRTPADVQRYFKQIGNVLNGLGSGNSFSETYLELPEINDGWRVHRKMLRKRKKKALKKAKKAAKKAKSGTATSGNKDKKDDDDNDDDDDDPPPLVDDEDTDVDQAKGENNEDNGDSDESDSDDEDEDDNDDSDDEDNEDEDDDKKKKKRKASGGDAERKRCQKGFETEHWKWLQENHPESFLSYHSFRAARNFVNKAKAEKIFDEYMEYVNQFCIGTDQTINNDTIYHLNSGILTILKKAKLTHMAVRILKFALPTSDNSPRLLMTRNDLAKVKNLVAKLKGSQAAKTSRKSTEASLFSKKKVVSVGARSVDKKVDKGVKGVNKDATDKDAGRRARRAIKPTAKPKSKPRPTSTAPVNEESTLLADIEDVIENAVQDIKEANVDQDFLEKSLDLGIVFGMEGKVTVDEVKEKKDPDDPTINIKEKCPVEIKLYSRLRKFIEKSIAMHHGQESRKDTDVTIPKRKTGEYREDVGDLEGLHLEAESVPQTPRPKASSPRHVSPADMKRYRPT